MQTYDFTLLINPTRYPQYIKKLKRLIRRGVNPRIIEAGSREEFRTEVGKFLAGPELYLLVWGGDGTAHLAINAWMDYSSRSGDPGADQKALGFLRGGSGNGIQDSYEVPFTMRRQVAGYLTSMRRGYIQKVDLLKIEGGGSSSFAQLAGIGFDAELIRIRERALEKGRRATSGMIGYLRAGISLMLGNPFRQSSGFDFHLKSGKYALRTGRANAEQTFEELEFSQNPLMIEVGTRPFYGRMFKICPDVVCNDGLLDLYIYLFRRRRQILYHLFSLWNGWHHRINKNRAERGRPLIERFELESMEILSETPFSYHVDGELRHAGKLSESNPGYGLGIGIAREAINFLVPESSHRKFHPESIDALRQP